MILYSNLWISCNGYVFTLLSTIALRLIYVYIIWKKCLAIYRRCK